jgi:hypothetical protein
MALNELFRAPTEIEGAVPEPAEAEPVEEGEELALELLELQAAISSAALRPAATTPAFLMDDTNVPRFCPP